MAKLPAKYRDIGLDDDGDFETQQQLYAAWDYYMKGYTIAEAADKASLQEWKVLNYAHTSRNGKPSWAEQRKQARLNFIKDSNDLTKVSLSRAYKSTADTLFKCLDKITQALETDKLSGNEAVRAADVLLRGIEKLHNIFAPALKSPLVNIDLSKKIDENEVSEKLEEWGLVAKPGKEHGNT